MSSVSDLMEAGADLRASLFGKTIAITDLSSVTHSFTGAVFYGQSAIDPVTGGFYNTAGASAEIKTSDLSTFTPLPEMIATVDGVTMRIAPDGVTPGQFLTRIRFVAKNAPSRAT